MALINCIEETNNLLDSTVNSYVQQKQRDEQLKKDLYDILKD